MAGTKDKGLIFKPDEYAQFECWADTSFSGDWDKDKAQDNDWMAKSRTGYMIMYVGCPIVWASKVQTKITLSMTEAEYIALSQALRDVIPMMQIMKKAKDMGVPERRQEKDPVGRRRSLSCFV